MKAVIVDVKGKDAVALCTNGQFEKIKNQDYSIGQEITLHAQTLHFPKQAAIAASAALVITAGGGIGTYTWSTPVSYVSLDINPSIAYSLNKFDRVISVAGMNDEGAAIVDEIGGSLKNTDIATALAITVEQLSNDAYLDTENTNYMVIGVYSDKDNKADALRSTVDAFTASTVDTCSITTVSVSKETKETADSYGITAGKMELINEIAGVAADPQEVDPAALADLTVAQLEQTKAAAATGTSLSSAVASATPETTEDAQKAADTPMPDAPIPDDSNAVVSDSKPETSSEHTSSASKEDAAASESSADGQLATVSEGATDIPAANPDTLADSSTPKPPSAKPVTPSAADSAEGTGNGSSIKNNDSHETKTDTPASDIPEDSQQKPAETTPPADANTSPAKGETTSSVKKDEDNSSDKTSEKKENTSPEKTDTVTEDDSQQTNSAPPDDSTSGDEQFQLPETSGELMLADNILS